ncbi:MAG: TIGR00730 family Rossman fold protein [Terracidiphilus sp.]
MRMCVFCGSTLGNSELYANAAREMGRTLAERGIELIYGGGRVGLMGVLADAALSAGGTVVGVMPKALVEREIQHPSLTTLHIVASMHERKTMMAELADGFIALPGGAGTLEEIFEQWTWAQLGIHHKPCGFLNTNGYFDLLRKMIDRMRSDGFLRRDQASMLTFSADPASVINAFFDYVAPPAKWQMWPDDRRIIRIVAALVQDRDGNLLLVRKRGTRTFMQPGGKLQPEESHLAALERELNEELSCSVGPDSPIFLGTFTSPAANEADCQVEAALYRLELVGPICTSSEIEEIAWINPFSPGEILLAPLTRDKILPLVTHGSNSGQRDMATR